MRQIIIDDCLKKVDNRFELVRVLAERAKQLNQGFKPLVDSKGEKNIMISMREVAKGLVYEIEEEQDEEQE